MGGSFLAKPLFGPVGAVAPSDMPAAPVGPNAVNLGYLFTNSISYIIASTPPTILLSAASHTWLARIFSA